MSRDVSLLLPEVHDKANELLARCALEGIILGIVQTYRTFDEQAAIYAQGRTAPGPIVTHSPPGYSWHNWKRAFDVDIVHFPGDPDTKDVWNGPWERVGEIGESLGLAWGGRWKSPDRPHFELTEGITLAGMLATWPKGLG